MNNDLDISQSLAQKTGWSAGASLCSLVGRLAVQIIIARMLGPNGVGRIAYIVWLIEIAYLLTNLGMPGSLTRYLAELYGQNKPEQAAFFARWVFFRYLMLSLAGSTAVGLFYFFSSQYKGTGAILPVLAILFVARGLENINRAGLAGRQRFDILARINVLATVVLIGSVFIGGYFYGVTGVLFGYLAGAFFPAAYSFTMLGGHKPSQKIDPDLRHRLWKFTFYTWFAMLISAFVWSRMEIYFLERYWDVNEVAMFTVALTFALLVRQVATMFSGSFMAHFSHLLSDGNHDLVQRQYITATKLMAFVVVPMAFGGAAIMPVLLPMVFGAKFLPAVPNAMVLTVSSALAFSGIGSALVYAKERPSFIAFGGIAGAVMSVTSGFLIISRYGAWGAVWSRLFVQISMIALGTWYIVTRLNFAFPFCALAKTTFAGVFSGLFAWSIIYFMPHSIITLTIAVPVGVIIYFLGVRLFGVLGMEEIRQLKRVINRLPCKIHRFFALILDAMVTDK